MGQEFKRQTDDDEDDEFVEKAEKLMEDANSFADKLAKAVGDARTAVEKKQKYEKADGAKKKSQPSSNEDDAMELNADSIADLLDAAIESEGDMTLEESKDKVNSKIDKIKAVKGNITLSEAKEFVEENPDMVNSFL